MNRLNLDRLEVIGLILVAGFAAILLLSPPFIGMADNGDFFRLMYWGQFAYPPLEYRDQYVGWVTRQFVVARNPLLSWRGFPSSEALFIKASALLSFPFSRNRFDLKVLGSIHVLAYAGAWAVVLSGWRRATGMRSMVLIPGIALIFCDVGYLAYFHSFYAEPASLIFTLTTLGLGLMLTARDGRSVILLALFYASAICLVLAKAQNLPFIAAFLVFGHWLRLSSTDLKWRRVNLAGLGLMTAAGTVLLLVTPATMREANLYNSVFNGILRSSESPADDLTALGLPREYETLRATTYFDSTSAIDIRTEEFRSRFFRVASPAKVIGFYLIRPSRLAEMLGIVSQRAYSLQPPALGNFEKASGAPFQSKTSRWTLWSHAKEALVPRNLWFSLAYLGLLLAVVVILWSRARSSGLPPLFLAFWLMMLISFVTPIPGDGENDLEKHLFLYNLFFDLSVVFLASCLLKAVHLRLDARKAS